MSIEQTNQLILLILNSVLMVLLSTLLVGGAWLRQASLAQELDALKRACRDRKYPSLTSPSVQATQTKSLRRQRHQAQRQYRLAYSGLLLLYGALVMFLINLLALALRTLVLADWLVPIALGLFIGGIAGLLAGAGLVLGDVYQSNLLRESPLKSLGKALGQIPRWHRHLFARRTSIYSVLPGGLNAVPKRSSNRLAAKPGRTRLRASSR
ncbi:MAG: hypothetical protein AAGC54_14635 [Cyanobacteria bacterium P01_F01_bin.4]